MSLADWQALGNDTNSFVAIPDELFVGPAKDDYHLKDGSPDNPAIDAGVCNQEGTTLAVVIEGCSTPYVKSDLEGVLRPQGESVDIGAYEYSISEPAPVADFVGLP